MSDDLTVEGLERALEEFKAGIPTGEKVTMTEEEFFGNLSERVYTKPSPEEVAAQFGLPWPPAADPPDGLGCECGCYGCSAVITDPDDLARIRGYWVDDEDTPSSYASLCRACMEKVMREKGWLA